MSYLVLCMNFFSPTFILYCTIQLGFLIGPYILYDLDLRWPSQCQYNTYLSAFVAGRPPPDLQNHHFRTYRLIYFDYRSFYEVRRTIWSFSTYFLVWKCFIMRIFHDLESQCSGIENYSDEKTIKDKKIPLQMKRLARKFMCPLKSRFRDYIVYILFSLCVIPG